MSNYLEETSISQPGKFENLGSQKTDSIRLGANVNQDKTISFMVWAPRVTEMFLQVRKNQTPFPHNDHSQEEQESLVKKFISFTQDSDSFPFNSSKILKQPWHFIYGSKLNNLYLLNSIENGYFRIDMPADKVRSGDMYRFLIKSNILGLDEYYPFKDPCSKFQPYGTDGWSQVVDESEYHWADTETKWFSNSNSDRIKSKMYGNTSEITKSMIINEMHIGLLTDEGTFESAIKYLDKIALDGIYNTIELMPVVEFYGSRNWGYDNVDFFAVSSQYSKDSKTHQPNPHKLKRFIEEAHKNGLNVLYDVVLNHYSGLSNINNHFGLYSKDNSPWGPMPNFYEKNVRKSLIDSVVRFIDDFHFDGVRFDAVHLIPNMTLKELTHQIRQRVWNKDVFLIAEDVVGNYHRKGIVTPMRKKEFKQKILDYREESPSCMGFDAQWTRRYSEILNALTTDQMGYGGKFKPSVTQLSSFLINNSLNYTDSDEIPEPGADTSVIYLQCHDNPGNFGGVRQIIKSLKVYLHLEKDIDLLEIENQARSEWYDRNDPDKEIKIKKLVGARYDNINNALAQDLLKSYKKLQKEDLWDTLSHLDWVKLQTELKIKSPVTKQSFENAMQIAMAYHRLNIGTLFASPGHKLILMGDEEADLATFKFFAEFPVENLHERISSHSDKGYDIGEDAFNDSRVGQHGFTDTEMKAYVKKIVQIYNENPSLYELKNVSKEDIFLSEKDKVIGFLRKTKNNKILTILNYSKEPKIIDLELMGHLEKLSGKWEFLMDSSDKSFWNDFPDKKVCFVDINDNFSKLNLREITLMILKGV